MTKKDKELLFKDLSARLPYGVKVEIKHYDNAWELLAIYTNGTTYASRDVGYPIETYFEDCKPYLFPMSSMTDEQKKELLELTGYEARCEESCGFDSWGFYVNIVGEYKYEDGKQSIILYPDDIGIDWLNKNHFDYRGLIEKGIALDATGKNIY